MASEGAGVEVHLERGPLREADLEPWEIMISESQERMVAVVDPEAVANVESVCRRWELPCAVIGAVSADGVLRVHFGSEEVGAVPARLLTEETPRYELAQQATNAPSARRVDGPADDPGWVFEQYDQLVGSRTVRRPGLDAAVLALGDGRGLALSLDGPAPGERDPHRAGWSAVMGAALNVACAGGEPLALTDCLNFGNPERPEIAWELAQAIEGIADAARELGIPVVSGNVSLYNETGGRPIPPTPVVGCVGLVQDVARIPDRWQRGDRAAFLPGAGAELVAFVWRNAHRFTLAHDVSEGSDLAAATRWSGFAANFGLPEQPGVVVTLPQEDLQPLEFEGALELGSV
jgi:phosphoribosylformylglycinamidine synthase